MAPQNTYHQDHITSHGIIKITITSTLVTIFETLWGLPSDTEITKWASAVGKMVPVNVASPRTFVKNYLQGAPSEVPVVETWVGGDVVSFWARGVALSPRSWSSPCRQMKALYRLCSSLSPWEERKTIQHPFQVRFCWNPSDCNTWHASKYYRFQE